MDLDSLCYWIWLASVIVSRGQMHVCCSNDGPESLNEQNDSSSRFMSAGDVT